MASKVQQPIEIPGTNFIVIDKATIKIDSEAKTYMSLLRLPNVNDIKLEMLTRLCRASLGLDYSEVETKIKVSRQLLGKIERGFIPSRRKIDELGKLFGPEFMQIVRDRNYFGATS